MRKVYIYAQANQLSCCEFCCIHYRQNDEYCAEKIIFAQCQELQLNWLFETTNPFILAFHGLKTLNVCSSDFIKFLCSLIFLCNFFGMDLISKDCSYCCIVPHGIVACLHNRESELRKYSHDLFGIALAILLKSTRGKFYV